MTEEELKNKLISEAQASWNKLNITKRACGSEFSYYDGYINCGTIKEKQIQIDAEQIRALQKQNGELTDKVKKLEEELEQAEKGKVVEHFEAYGQCRDSRRIAELEAQIKKMRNCANCKNYNGNEGFCVLGSGYGYNCNLEKWEIKEK